MTASGGASQDFASFRSAIFFLMERLPEFERETAFVQTDEAGGHYTIQKIREIYQAVRLENSHAGDEAALPGLPKIDDEPYDGSPV